MITSDSIPTVYAGNNTATVFPYLFPVTDKTYIEIVRTNADTTVTPLVVDVDYTVNGVGNTDSSTWTILYPISGSPMPTGVSISIVPNLPLVQETNYSNQGGYFPKTVESSLDFLTIIAQQQKEAISRCIQVPLGTTEVIAPADLVAAVEGYAATAATSATSASASQTASAVSATAAAASAASIQPFDINQYAVATGTNTYTATLSPVPGSYMTGMKVSLLIPSSNTGAATINLNALGAKAVKNSGAALVGGEMQAGQTAEFTYDGTAFQLGNATPLTFGAAGASHKAGAVPDPGATVSTPPQQLTDQGFKLPSAVGMLHTCKGWLNATTIPATSLAYARSGATVTLTDTAHGLTTGAFIEVTSATDSGINNYGILIVVTGANTYTFQTTATGAASGTLTRRSAIRANYNVNGITSQGTGLYTIHFNNIPMNDALYAVNVGVGGILVGGVYATDGNYDPILKNATGVQIQVNNASATPKDTAELNVTIFGN